MLIRNKLKILSLVEIEKMIIEHEMQCLSCGKKFKPNSIRRYQHDGGIYIKDDPKKQWVSMLCECDYQTSLWKIQKRILRKKLTMVKPFNKDELFQK